MVTGVQDLEICADPLLVTVFSNLLDNSLRDGERGHEIRVFCYQTRAGLTLVWGDNGIGISSEEKVQIFRQGYGENSGLGLFLVQEILGITGFIIREKGEPGKGARFEIRIPVGSYRRSSGRTAAGTWHLRIAGGDPGRIMNGEPDAL